MLYIVMLGGKHPKAKIEVHDVVFAVGNSLADCYPSLKAQWFGDAKNVHIDSWLALDGYEGYRFEWSNIAPAPGQLKLFFINLGGYTEGVFGEAHQYLLVVAADAKSAKSFAKAKIDSAWQKPHADAVLDVDDCVVLDEVEGRYLHLSVGHHQKPVQANDYIIL